MNILGDKTKVRFITVWCNINGLYMDCTVLWYCHWLFKGFGFKPHSGLEIFFEIIVAKL